MRQARRPAGRGGFRLVPGVTPHRINPRQSDPVAPAPSFRPQGATLPPQVRRMPILKRSVPIERSSLICLGALLILGYALGSALPHGPWFRDGGIIGKAAAWDAEHYEYISLYGYRNGETAAASSLIAFFPGWPLIESVLIAIAGSPQAGRFLAILFCGCAGIASVFVFSGLARSLLSPQAASVATLLYTLYPGAHFLFQPYPTALMQLFTVLVLKDLLAGRLWRAALVSGVATAFGPLMTFIGLAVVLTGLTTAWRKRRVNPHAFRQFCTLAPLLGTVAVSGLLLFALWQALVFGNPFAFITAGENVEVPMTLVLKAKRALALVFVFPDLIRAGARLDIAVVLATSEQWSRAQVSFEDAVNLLFLFFMSVGTILAFRLRAKELPLAAILVIGGFIWFAGAPQGGQAGIRLLYPAIAGFLGLGSLADTNRTIAWVLPPTFAAFLVLDQAFLVAGYWVV